METVNGFKATPCAAITNPLTSTMIAGLVLAGGRSSRMGQDKANLVLNGESLLHRAYRLLSESGCVMVYLSGHPRANWPGEASSTIPDLTPDAGPVAALCSAIAALPATVKTVLVCAVDTPLLSPELMGTLRNTLNAQTNCDAACFQRHPLPLALRLNPTVQQHAEQALQQIQAGTSYAVGQFLGELHTIRLAADALFEHQLSNINTPGEWAWLQSITHSCSHPKPFSSQASQPTP